ncbi:MAG: hypothetical protein JO187_08250, partial [Acidobacteria bacterium]|nr:hypothetical protein [Acidobacteriota bacterium]
MRKLVLLAFLGVLIAGCAAKKQKVALPTAPLPPPLPQSDSLQLMAAAELRQSTAVLEQLVRSPENQVPDAVLSRTKCLVLTVAPGAHGIAICRDPTEPDRWNSPASVRFTGTNPSPTPPGSNWLLFVLADGALPALQSASSEFRPVLVSPGLLVRQTPAVTDADLKGDVLSYRFDAGALSGSPFRASSFLLDRSETERLYGREPHPVPLGNSPSSGPIHQFIYTVTSYFNTITPEGIIIHHTAIVPETRKVPRNAAEVDRYHESRGFGIFCLGREYHAAYHYMIFPDGRIQAGRPEHCAGAHA